MKKYGRNENIPERTRGGRTTDEDKICFIISPIGEEGTDTYEKFKEVLDYVVKPAISNSDYKLRVLRADDIERAGSFIKDILEYVAGSFIVIADLTSQNPNVFYELGVRHSLSPRTVLIAQSLDDIPSDLREYRTIIYDTTAKGVVLFTKRLTNYLKEIFNEPGRPDNPVLDRLDSIIDSKTADLQAEKASLKAQITEMLKEGASPPQSDNVSSVTTRMDRILKLGNAVEQDGIFKHGSFKRTVDDEEESIRLEIQQGHFRLYFRMREVKIYDFWYVSIVETAVNIEEELADIRVLLEDCYRKDTRCTFIIATNDDLSSQAESIQKAFGKMQAIVGIKKGLPYELEIWDREGLLTEEKRLGIKVDM